MSPVTAMRAFLANSHFTCKRSSDEKTIPLRQLRLAHASDARMTRILPANTLRFDILHSQIHGSFQLGGHVRRKVDRLPPLAQITTRAAA